MGYGIGTQLAMAAEERERNRRTRERWVPLSALASIPRPVYVGVDSDPQGWRFEVLRFGWRRWLDGIGQPLPPINLVFEGNLRLADGNHRLTTARELGVPLLAQPGACVASLFGWPRDVDAAELQSERATKLMVDAPSEAEAEEFRQTLSGLVIHRLDKTGEDFATAARAMLNGEPQALACKFDRSESDPRIIVGDLVRGLSHLPHTVSDVRDFVVARMPADTAHYEISAIPLLQRSRDMIDRLLDALRGIPS